MTRGPSSSSVSSSASEEAAEQQVEQMWATAAVLMAAPTSVLFVASLTSSWILVSASAESNYITAEPGYTVTLPCRAPSSSEIRAVEWTRPDLDPEEIFLYWNKRFDPDNQHPSFKERVELKDSQMKDGDVSVTLKDVTLNDTGTYECRVAQSQSKGPDPISIIHLRVSVDMMIITAEPGDTVTLPCQVPRSSEILILLWTRPDLDPDYVFVYRNKRSDPDNQHPSFKERVELKDSQMKDGDVSVTLKDVVFTDTGTYECHVIQRSAGSLMSTIYLNVTQAAAASDRHLSVLRIILCIVVSSPYIISTFLLVSVHRQRPAGQRTITAEPGQNVTLPCEVNNSEITHLQWTRPDLYPDYVFVYRHGRFDLENQHPHFKKRVELKNSQMKDGDVSVTLKNVTFTDTGTYECRDFQGQSKGPELINIIHLRVSAGHTGGHKDGGDKGGGDQDGGDQDGGDQDGGDQDGGDKRRGRTLAIRGPQRSGETGSCGLQPALTFSVGKAREAVVQVRSKQQDVKLDYTEVS
ncbi:CD226 antigen-like [Mastacembelus armatus]|uniref:CD226 antigen-like n=1 Tax=Mastacembelus armatus TaxID=205130 RepID=UPI000E46064C|nr:CD226 antigen-like [Mastacembelus armatus]